MIAHRLVTPVFLFLTKDWRIDACTPSLRLNAHPIKRRCQHSSWSIGTPSFVLLSVSNSSLVSRLFSNVSITIDPARCYVRRVSSAIPIEASRGHAMTTTSSPPPSIEPKIWGISSVFKNILSWQYWCHLLVATGDRDGECSILWTKSVVSAVEKSHRITFFVVLH